MNIDKWISIFTMAGIVGLLILNADGAVAVIKGVGGVANDYVRTVQGR